MNKHFEYAKIFATIGSFIIVSSSIMFSISNNAVSQANLLSLALNETGLSQPKIVQEQATIFYESYYYYFIFGWCLFLLGLYFIGLSVTLGWVGFTDKKYHWFDLIFIPSLIVITIFLIFLGLGFFKF